MTDQIIRSKYLYRGPILKLRLDQVRLASGQVVARQVIEHPGAVAIVALDEKERVLMVRQYRPGAQSELLEIPAGTMEPGENPALCAKRELKEETGYRARHWNPLGYFYSSPGFCTEKMYLFLARQLTPGLPAPEEDELIRFELVPLARAIRMIERGEIRDAKTIVGLLRAWKLIEDA